MTKLRRDPWPTEVPITLGGYLPILAFEALTSLGFVSAFAPIPSSTRVPRTRILIIGHDREKRRALAFLCGILDGQPTVAESVYQALELAKNHSFELIIVEHNLPAMDGVAAIQKLRENKMVAPAILLTRKSEVNLLIYPSFLNIKAVLKNSSSLLHLKRALKKGLS